LQPYLEWPRITPNVRFQGHAIIWRWILAKFQWQSIDTDTEVKCRVGCKSFNKLISCSKTIIECCDTVCIYHNTCLPSLVNICQTVFEKSPCNRFLLYISDIAGYAARSARSSACPASSSSRQASRYLASSYIWWICLGQKNRGKLWHSASRMKYQNSIFKWKTGENNVIKSHMLQILWPSWTTIWLKEGSNINNYTMSWK